MSNLNSSTLLLSILFSTHAFAVELLPDYRSGPETCSKQANFIKDELGTTIWVPVNYQDPSRGNTPLYFWSKSPLDSSKPALIFVIGGPGQSSHKNEFAERFDDFNVIFFDQRGSSCSKPLTEELYRDPTFYSLENTARDIEEIRKKLGVERISVYGHSYGTVPATIYGSLFPERTRSVILEGVVFESGPSLYQSEFTRNLMQKHFDQMPEETRKKILALSSRSDLVQSWYSRLAWTAMRDNDPFTFLDYFLTNAFSLPEADAPQNLGMFNDSEFTESEFGPSLMIYAMHSCKELGYGAPFATFYYNFDDKGQLVSDQDPKFQNQLCEDLKISGDQIQYSASRYPLHVPVTYFQGEYDGATNKFEAIKHFESAQGFAQLLIMEKGGHKPNMKLLKKTNETRYNALQSWLLSKAVSVKLKLMEKLTSKWNQNLLNKMGESPAGLLQQKIFTEAVLGKPISPTLLEEFNRSNELKWTYSKKP